MSYGNMDYLYQEGGWYGKDVRRKREEDDECPICGKEVKIQQDSIPPKLVCSCGWSWVVIKKRR